jgi:hypothetical protein
MISGWHARPDPTPAPPPEGEGCKRSPDGGGAKSGVGAAMIAFLIFQRQFIQAFLRAGVR